jgi:hypothetical protein
MLEGWPERPWRTPVLAVSAGWKRVHASRSVSTRGVWQKPIHITGAQSDVEASHSPAGCQRAATSGTAVTMRYCSKVAGGTPSASESFCI